MNIDEKLDRILELLEKKKKPNPRRAHEYTPEFEAIWGSYPARAGANSKQKAFTAYRMRQLEGVTVYEMSTGTDRYKNYCIRTSKIKTEYVMQGSRFFGSGREYENEWVAPKQLMSDADWKDAGMAKGIEARPGESMVELKRRIEVALR